MKKLTYLTRYFCLLIAPLLMLSCDDDENAPTIAFSGIASSAYESDGTSTITLPLIKTGSVPASEVEIRFGGTATEGEDYTLVGTTDEGVQISIIDDDDLETNETIRVEMINASAGGNRIHTITIVSNCEDTDGLELDFFAGEYDAVEDYGAGGTYGPYAIELVQDDTDPAMFHFDNLYDSGCDAYMIFDLAAGTVHFPDQAPCGVDLTNSSGTFSLCGDETLTINLNFDGGDWVYRFSKH